MGALLWMTYWLLVFFGCLFLLGVTAIGLLWLFLHLGAWVFRGPKETDAPRRPRDPTQN